MQYLLGGNSLFPELWSGWGLALSSAAWYGPWVRSCPNGAGGVNRREKTSPGKLPKDLSSKKLSAAEPSVAKRIVSII